jgi:hypothetical protein
MPENMSDRMPEDLPVTKCINVMVGITRSKVISSFSLLWTFPSESSRITSTLQVGRLPDAYEKLIHDAGISLNILKCGRVSWLPDTVCIASAC